ncbi:MAG: type VI secretion system baseplate subunit TssF [Acidobacteria bacterium]|nr:MAG: type VI secretion system baseplate subunit TssF [Acidobacteriota bacterium]MCE7959049.1 type VI secretion system baseplate subunit TssF [Acidobacteria bacterium ACB2]
MRDELLGYYERELAFLRLLGAEFAEKYPKIAARLVLEPDRCEDPHVERLIESVAFLASRVHLKVDDELPEVTESFLNVLAPNLLAPVPSMSIVQFVLDPSQVSLQAGHRVDKGAVVYTRAVSGTSCRFRTAYPVDLWPMEVKSARFELPVPGVGPEEGVRTVLRLELKTFGDLPLSDLKRRVSESEERPIDRVRVYLQGEGKAVYSLYEHLLNDVVAVELRPGGPRDVPSPIRLDPSCVKPVGFERDEGLLPYTDRSFMGYRLLQEYFAFPEKFLFLDFTGLERAVGHPAFTDTLEVVFYFRREFALERNVTAQTFRLHATPIVNLFSHVAEPIRLTHLQPEYRVVADVRRQEAMEVYSVGSVTATIRNTDKVVEFRPFYSFQHGYDREAQKTFWYASRRPSTRKDDEGTEVYLSLVDLGFHPSQPDADTITVEVTCTNRDLPGRLPIGSGEGDFQLEGAGVFSTIRCLRKPTPTLRIPLRRGLQWRLVSHLSLNVLSLVEGGRGPEALQEILRLYDYADSAATRQQIAGLTKLSAQRVLRSVGALHASFVRGLEVTVELDETQYIGAGPYLFASVLERFLGLYASVNSFSQLVLGTRQREGVLKRWPPRAGESIIL